LISTRSLRGSVNFGKIRSKSQRSWSRLWPYNMH